jgi:hypothetical protein
MLSTIGQAGAAGPPIIDVLVCSTPARPCRHQLMDRLDANGIEYESRDVTHYVAARNEILELTGGLSIPVLVADGDAIVGFDVAAHAEKESRPASGTARGYRSTGRHGRGGADHATFWGRARYRYATTYSRPI